MTMMMTPSTRKAESNSRVAREEKMVQGRVTFSKRLDMGRRRQGDDLCLYGDPSHAHEKKQADQAGKYHSDV